ncbi:helix-turn-helix domain-containing protein [Saccharothrix syringae]|uniref:helix-turn-helix domain-containing protein n=1 Tax=Saccharothrix syringae TaxID=103733 RepID=UPI001D17388E|nr:helix-turn-helix transcriptional regulator [Saccharothrix syringae]
MPRETSPGEVIRSLRVAEGLTKHQLAERMHFSMSLLDKVERGERVPHPRRHRRRGARVVQHRRDDQRSALHWAPPRPARPPRGRRPAHGAAPLRPARRDGPAPARRAGIRGRRGDAAPGRRCTGC